MSPKITLRYLKPSISSHPPANRGWIVMRGLFKRKPAGNLYLDILDWLDAGERWIRSRMRSGTMNGARFLRERGHMRSDPHWWYTRSVPAISWSGLRSAESMRMAIDPSLIRSYMFELRMGWTLFFLFVRRLSLWVLCGDGRRSLSQPAAYWVGHEYLMVVILKSPNVVQRRTSCEMCKTFTCKKLLKFTKWW